jgi:hypothetical protein
VNGETRTEREREAVHLGSLAHIAAQKAEEALRALRKVEVDQETAFELVREAEEAWVDAGSEWKPGMNAETAAAYQVWGCRVDGELPELPEALR